MDILCTDYAEHGPHAWESTVCGMVHCKGRKAPRTIELPRSMHLATAGKIACIRKEPESTETLCGKKGAKGQAEFSDHRSALYVDQHCIDCTAEFRRTHDDYTPVTF